MSNVNKNECVINGVQYKCRTCFDPGRTFFQLIDEAVNKKAWIDLLTNITHFQTNDDEKLPKTLCCKCTDKLKKSYEFILQIQDVNEKYSELLTKNEVSNQIDNAADCLEESAIALPLEPFVAEVKLEEDMVMSYEMEMETNDMQEDNEDNFDNEDRDDPFTGTFGEEKTTEEDERAIETMEEKPTKRKQRHRKIKESENVLKTEDLPVMEIKIEKVVEQLDAELKKPEQIKQEGKVLIKMENDQKIKKKRVRKTKKIGSVDEMKQSAENKQTDQQTSKTEKVRKAVKVEKVKKPRKFDKISEVDSNDGKGDVACAHCPQTFFTYHAYQRHQYKAHPEQYVGEEANKKCPICFKILTTKHTVILHLKSVHDKIRPFKCAHCPKTFGQFSAKNIHELTHTDIFPHPCEFCPCRFRALGKLKQHMDVHTFEPDLLCPICKRGKKSKEELEAHMKIHSLQCPTCGKLFKRKCSLDDHYNCVHLKIKRFQCRYCDHSSRNIKARIVHERSKHKKFDSSAQSQAPSINL